MLDTAMGARIDESGVVTPAWSEFCIAEFTSDYTVKDYETELFYGASWRALSDEGYCIEIHQPRWP